MSRSFDFSNQRPMPQAKHWGVVVQRDERIRNNFAMELALSYPVPGPGELNYFHYRDNRKQGTISVASRIRADVKTLAVTEILTSPTDDIFPGLELSQPATKVAFDASIEDAFWDSYDILIRKYPHQRAGSVGEHWVDALERLVSPELLPFYEALNPSFFDWCRGKEG